jgi:hypothetical protein
MSAADMSQQTPEYPWVAAGTSLSAVAFSLFDPPLHGESPFFCPITISIPAVRFRLRVGFDDANPPFTPGRPESFAPVTGRTIRRPSPF